MSRADPAAAVPAEPRLTSLLVMSEHDGNPGLEYVIGGVNLVGPDREQAAQLLADDAMRIRCGKSPVLARWRARRDGGLPRTPERRQRLSGHTPRSASGFRTSRRTPTTCRGLSPSCCGTG